MADEVSEFRSDQRLKRVSATLVVSVSRSIDEVKPEAEKRITDPVATPLRAFLAFGDRNVLINEVESSKAVQMLRKQETRDQAVPSTWIDYSLPLSIRHLSSGCQPFQPDDRLVDHREPVPTCRVID